MGINIEWMEDRNVGLTHPAPLAVLLTEEVITRIDWELCVSASIKGIHWTSGKGDVALACEGDSTFGYDEVWLVGLDGGEFFNFVIVVDDVGFR